ncbi:MAG: neutral/alkaline non-lysosomal ceramidase N-terminal domain-containing protein [Oceanicoccus sp.]
MRTANNRFLSNLATILCVLFLSPTTLAVDSSNYLIGRGMADVTGPAYGSPMWGFGKEGQNTQGIHIRLKSRAFIFIDPVSKKRLVFTSVDIGSIEHNVVLEVVDRLQARFAGLYTLDNLILSATHTHAGPAGYWHTRTEFGLSGSFYKTHFERIVSGIVSSIVLAHENIQPGQIMINKGNVEGAGANRSMAAYNANPAEERARYGSPMDTEMTLLKLVGKDGPIGLVNWFAVHPTSMTYDNRLISGDHKGFAASSWEIAEQTDYIQNQGFIAAFAQSTPGDVTPNLNLDNTGPGENEIASTQIIGQRQLDVGQNLYANATELVSGPVDIRRAYIDMSNVTVRDEFTGAGVQTTCPSAYGYTFAAGSTEDGGGNFLFEEGMTEQSWWLDIVIRWVTGAEKWTQAVKDCQAPKAILFETGTGDTPLQSQIRSVSVARLGSLAIVAMPAEVTTMAARRIRQTLRQNLGPWAKHIVIAGYANGYGGYVTTPEEYETQQYEGGHTLHGKWSLAAYQQLITLLAHSLDAGSSAPEGPEYDDWRGKSVSASLVGDLTDALSDGYSYGDALPMSSQNFRRGEEVIAEFWSGNPSSQYRSGNNYLQIQRQNNGIWHPVHGDMDWSTTIRWREDEEGMIARIVWRVPTSAKSGVYRVKHFGQYRQIPGQLEEFEALSAEFEIEN